MIRTTEDALLGRRVRLLQPRDGYRVAVDTPLLAASVPATAGESVLDLGCGFGGAALCLMIRVPGVTVRGIEANPAFAELALKNAELNAVERALTVEVGSVAKLAASDFDHAMANPPFYSGGTPAPDAGKEAAHRFGDTVLDDWVRAAVLGVRPEGTATFILPADQEPALATALERYGVGSIRILPLLPKPGRAPKRVIIRGRAGRDGPTTRLDGLVLHQEDGSFTDRARKILWDAAPLLPLGA